MNDHASTQNSSLFTYQILFQTASVNASKAETMVS